MRILTDSFSYLSLSSKNAAYGARHNGPSGKMLNSSPSNKSAMRTIIQSWKKHKELLLQVSVSTHSSTNSLLGDVLSLSSSRERFSQVILPSKLFSLKTPSLEHSKKVIASSTFLSSFRLRGTFLSLLSTQKWIMVLSSAKNTVCVEYATCTSCAIVSLISSGLTLPIPSVIWKVPLRPALVLALLHTKPHQSFEFLARFSKERCKRYGSFHEKTFSSLLRTEGEPSCHRIILHWTGNNQSYLQATW